MENKNNGRVTLYTFVIICALTFILFFQYIIGVKSFYFMHVVSDGVMQFYPNYVELSKALKQSMFGAFSWTKGWGGYVMDTNPFSRLITLFGENHIIYMTGLVTALKVTLTGLCFSLYLKELKVEKITNIVYSIMYAFSIQVIGGGCWSTQAELAIILPVFLYAVEKYKNTKKTGGFFVGIILSILSLSLYFMLVMSAFVIAYAIVSNILQNDKKIQIKKKYIIIFALVIFLIFALNFSAFRKIFQSYRFQKGLNYLDDSFGKIFTIKNIKTIMTTVLRSFSPNMLGIIGVNMYYGSEYGLGYIVDGSFYAGILMLLMIPQAFHKDNRKRNIIFGMGIATCFLVTVFPPLRLILAGFGNDEFRLIRIWFLFILLFISCMAFNDLYTGKYKLSKKRLYITSAVCIALLTAGIPMHIYLFDYVSAIIIIVIYNVLLTLCFSHNKKAFVILICFVCAEALFYSYPFINNKDAIYTSEWEEEKYYNDKTEEVISLIEEKGDEPFRINKAYMSVMLNDASIQNFEGTAYYIGGVGVPNCTDFNVSMGIPSMFNNRNYCMGSCGNVYADSLLAVRYAVSHSDEFYENGYDFEKSEYGLNLYHNSNDVPFAFFYDKYILREEFDKLSLQDRKRNILNFAVIDEATDKLTKCDKNEIINSNGKILWNESVSGYKCGDVIPVKPLEKNEVMIIETVSDEEYLLGLKWAVNGEWQDDNSQYMSIYEENGNAVAEVTNQPGTNYVVLYSYGTEGGEIIQKLNIYILDAKEYYSEFDVRIDEIKNDDVELLDYSSDNISFLAGEEKAKMLFMSIPYDAGFDIYIDGKKVEKYKVDYAFTGVIVPEGNHVVEARYKRHMPKQYKEAAAIIVIYILLSLCLIMKKKINERRSKEND